MSTVRRPTGCLPPLPNMPLLLPCLESSASRPSFHHWGHFREIVPIFSSWSASCHPLPLYVVILYPYFIFSTVPLSKIASIIDETFIGYLPHLTPQVECKLHHGSYCVSSDWNKGWYIPGDQRFLVKLMRMALSAYPTLPPLPNSCLSLKTSSEITFPAVSAEWPSSLHHLLSSIGIFIKLCCICLPPTLGYVLLCLLLPCLSLLSHMGWLQQQLNVFDERVSEQITFLIIFWQSQLMLTWGDFLECF